MKKVILFIVVVIVITILVMAACAPFAMKDDRSAVVYGAIFLYGVGGLLGVLSGILILYGEYSLRGSYGEMRWGNYILFILGVLAIIGSIALSILLINTNISEYDSQHGSIQIGLDLVNSWLY